MLLPIKTHGGTHRGKCLRPVHFISGLPRSGPTLLAGWLRQNPRFHAGMSGPVGGLFSMLVSDPAAAMKAICALIGETALTHDFDNVGYAVDEFDTRAGTPGLHTVRSKIAVRERASVLPPDVFRRFENDAFWRDPQLNLRGYG
jgi:hypothetical protein